MKSFYYVETTEDLTLTETDPTPVLELQISGDPTKPRKFLVMAHCTIECSSVTNSSVVGKVYLSTEKESADELGNLQAPNALEIASLDGNLLSGSGKRKPFSAFGVTDNLWGGANFSLVLNRRAGAATITVRDVRIVAIAIPEDLIFSDDFYSLTNGKAGEIELDPVNPIGTQTNQPTLLAGGSLSSRGATDASIPQNARYPNTYGRNMYGGSLNAKGGRYMVLASGTYKAPSATTANRQIVMNSQCVVFQPSTTNPADPFTPDANGDVIYPYYSDRILPLMPLPEGHPVAAGTGGNLSWNAPDNAISSDNPDVEIPFIHGGIVTLREGVANIAVRARVAALGAAWSSGQTAESQGFELKNINVLLMPLDGWFDYDSSTSGPVIIKIDSNTQDADDIVMTVGDDVREESTVRNVLDIIYANGVDSPGAGGGEAGPFGLAVLGLLDDDTTEVLRCNEDKLASSTYNFISQPVLGFRAGNWSDKDLNVYVHSDTNINFDPAGAALAGNTTAGLLYGGGFALRLYDRSSNRTENTGGNAFIQVQKQLDLEWSIGGAKDHIQLNPLTSLKIETVVGQGVPAGTAGRVEIVDNSFETCILEADDTILSYDFNFETDTRTHYPGAPLGNDLNPWSP